MLKRTKSALIFHIKNECILCPHASEVVCLYSSSCSSFWHDASGEMSLINTKNTDQRKKLNQPHATVFNKNFPTATVSFHFSLIVRSSRSQLFSCFAVWMALLAVCYCRALKKFSLSSILKEVWLRSFRLPLIPPACTHQAAAAHPVCAHHTEN